MTLGRSRFFRGDFSFLFALLASTFLSGCLVHPEGRHESRKGDEIMVAGQLFHTGTKVVLWTDPGGYDAYRVERRFVPYNESSWAATKEENKHLESPNRYGLRSKNLTDEERERVRGGGWDLPTLQAKVDQFVLHFDVAGVSRNCFKTLQDQRDLSVHLMLDLDGTIYQTLDLKERAWHATTSNDRSVGIEIANIGAYRNPTNNALTTWYKKDKCGRTYISIPESVGPHPLRTKNFVARPARRDLVKGEVQGEMLYQYDFTPQQYKALAKLTATLCTVFPKINCDYPRQADGKLMTHKLPDAELRNYQGVLGHYHIQTDKVDPGPALQWDYVIDQARHYMKQLPRPTVNGEAIRIRPKLIVNN